MPRKGTPSPCTRSVSARDEVLIDQRVDGGAGGADAGEDDALGGAATSAGLEASRAGRPRCSRA